MIRDILRRLRITGVGVLAVVLLSVAACMISSCTVDNGDEADRYHYATSNDTYCLPGVLIGDIDVVTSDEAEVCDTTRYSDVKTYMGKETMAVEGFPVSEIIAYIPGARLTDGSPVLNVDYVSDPLPSDFNSSDDCLYMEITPKTLEFWVSADGERHQVAAVFGNTTGAIRYEQIIHWKYSFCLHLLSLRLDGQPVDEYDNRPDSRKLKFAFNAWVMTYDMFYSHNSHD